MDHLSDVKLKIKKLLAVASSANENEAALAMGMAQELLIRHRLTEADLPDSQTLYQEEIIRDKEPLFAAGRIHVWKSQLANILAKYNNCRLVKYSGIAFNNGSRGSQLVIFGRPSDIDMVRYMLAYGITTLTNFAHIPCMSEGHTYKQSWFLGAVNGIAEKLEEAKNRAEVGASKFALIKVNNLMKEVDKYIEDQVGKLRNAPKQKLKLNGDAYSKGVEVGRNFNFGDSKNLRQTNKLGMK